jgi:hypothetical protein
MILIKSLSTNGQTLAKDLVKTLVNPLTSLNLSRTFSAFSKFHLNTSNSPNIKVVRFFMGHNFYVERHFKFEVELGEKPWSTPSISIHRR